MGIAGKTETIMGTSRTTSALFKIGSIACFLAGGASGIPLVLGQLDPADTAFPQVLFLLFAIFTIGSITGLAVQIRLARRIFSPTVSEHLLPNKIRFSQSAAPIRPHLPGLSSAPREPAGMSLDRLAFGRYRIQRQVGAGGMGIVYLALDPSFQRQVAVKVLPAHLCANVSSRERFRREARAIAALEHAAAVPVYDFGEERGQPYLVMRFLPGGSLQDRLQGVILPPSAAAEILRRIIPALAKAHAMGMIHRDIKPGNILFDGEENPYLGDFGLAKLLEGDESLSHGDFFGTPTYASPEQCRGDQTIDHRSDIYSLTAMFFRMLTGFPPYTGNAPAIMAKHLSDPIPRLDAYATGLPSGTQSIIDCGMAKESRDRYASVLEMAGALDKVFPR
jgi:serine/threonine protein kinase